jgi:hypothetical protein
VAKINENGVMKMSNENGGNGVAMVSAAVG